MPLIADLVEIGVTHAAIKDFDFDILGARGATLNRC
jgi:hypothetical protein